MLEEERLDEVEWENIVVVIERNKELMEDRKLGELIIEEIESIEIELVDEKVVEDEEKEWKKIEIELGEEEKGKIEKIGDVEELENIRIEKEGLKELRRKKERNGRFKVIDEIIDDVVVEDLDKMMIGRIKRMIVGKKVEEDDRGIGGLGKR